MALKNDGHLGYTDTLNLIKHSKKLMFCSMFKTDGHNKDSLGQIAAINTFLLRNHLLRIETGRYTVPKTAENLRICPISVSVS